MEYIEKIIQSDPDKMGKIFEIIMNKNNHYWKKFDGPEDIYKWLHNFSNEEEIYLALLLANNILYYSEKQIGYLWKLILNNRIKLFLLDKKSGDIEDLNIEKWFQDYLRKKCIFVGYSVAGKSGQSMVYPFKKSHNITGLKYMELYEFLYGCSELKEKEKIFLLDDFIGSGDQAVDSWNKKIKAKNGVKRISFNDLYEENQHLEFIYLTLVGFKKGREKIENNSPLKVIIGEEIDDRFKCFSDVSVIYENSEERKKAKEVMEKKGRILYKYPLGYKNMELAVAFHHNTPNNSLPVIWKKMSDGSWYPLFERNE